MTNKRRIITLNEEEIDSVDRALTSAIAKRFNMNARDMVRYCLVHADELIGALDQRETDISVIRRDLKVIADRVDEAMDTFEDITKETRGRPKRRTAKPTEAEEADAGRLICEELGGIVQGHMCFYKKFEITPAKTTFETEVGLPLSVLTENLIDEQYFPSKEEYEALKAKGL